MLSVAPAADPKARSFEVTVAIDNPTMKLRSGMIASIRVADDAANGHQVRIPIDALVHDPIGDQYLVYTLEQKDGGITAVKAVHVRPGPLVGNQVSILGGLTAGQRIVAVRRQPASPRRRREGNPIDITMPVSRHAH